MLRLTWVLTSVWLLASGCVQSNVVPCGDNAFCPEGSTCDSIIPGRCLRPEQLVACETKQDEEPCDIQGAQGTCHGSACDLWTCGDGYVNGNDSCDGVNLGGATCITEGYYSAGGLACTPACTFDTSACGGGTCGDGVINGPEQCDGATNQTCFSIGFDGGSVGCSDATCSFAVDNCSKFGWNPESLNDVEALAVGGFSPDDIWAVGSSGRAIRYDGRRWLPSTTNVTNHLISVWGIAADDVWAVGLGTSTAVPSLLLRFDGTSWNRVVSAPPADYVDIWAASSSAVFAATSASGIQAFDGTTWSQLGTFNRRAVAIRGSSINDIWVATEADALNGELMHWNGTGWSAATLTNAKIRFIDVNSPDDVWVAGHDNTSRMNGLIAHFDGTKWTTWRDQQQVYNAIASSARNDAWVAGADGHMRHFDGVGWTTTTYIGATPQGTSAVSGLISFNGIEVVAVSTLKLAYRYRGQAFGRVQPLPFSDPFAASTNLAMWSTSAVNMWVATAKGEVFRYDGTAWSLSLLIDPTGTVLATSIWGTSASDVWVGTNDGRVFQLDGVTWTPHDVAGFGLPVTKVWGAGANDVWAFAVSGAFHWNGTSWTRHALSATRVLGAEGSATNDIYAVTAPDANGDALWRWNGTAWSPAPRTGPDAFLPTTRINNVVAIAPDLVFVVANNGHIHRWDGTMWTDDVVEAVAELTLVAGSAPDDVIAASERELFHWDQRQWSAVRPPLDFVPNTLDYLPMTDLSVMPGRVDMLLSKSRIRNLLRTRPLTCRSTELDCSDGVDDDCNGLIDRADASQCP